LLGEDVMGARWIAVIVVVACGVGSCTTRPSVRASETGTPAVTASPSPLPVVARRLRPAPARCADPKAPPLLGEQPPWGPLFGSSPAFGGVYARADRKAHAFHVGTNTRRTPNGWMVKVLWVLEPGTRQVVSLSGREVESGSPIMFRGSDGKPAAPTMVLDPDDPGTPTEEQGWLAYPSNLFFARAGCYAIEARWPGGSWGRVFGFGK
jgi:hypothetical protein